MNTSEVLRAYDEQLRRSLEPPAPGWVIEQSGPVLRMRSPDAGGWGCVVLAADLDAANADDAIEGQVSFFAGMGREFEWKWHGYDEPADLPDRLVRAGFKPDDPESLVVGEVAEVVQATASSLPPDGVAFRRLEPASADADFERIGRLKVAVWGGDATDQIKTLRAEWQADPERIGFHLAEAAEQLVCAAWIRFHPGTAFASLWGGATLPQWRRRGIYRHLVARRAQEALDRGYRYLQVDASNDSLPTLQRLGFERLTATTPYIWTPPRYIKHNATPDGVSHQFRTVVP